LKNNTPEVRFPGYRENWEERRINKLVSPVVREVPKPDKPYERISVRSHAKGTFHQKVDDPTTVSMDRLYVVKENDLIVNITFAWEHAIAVANKEDDGLLVSHRFPTFIIDKSDINFIHYLVIQENFRRKMELISPGGAGRNRVLNKKDFVNLSVDVPTQIEEQTEIGEFFKRLDETIALHQQELITLKQTKLGFLQKMFPKEGAFVPEVRFPGFTGDWEESELGEKVDFYSGLTYSPEHIKEDGTLVLRSSNVKNGELIDADNVYVDSTAVNSKSVEIGDVIVVVRNGSRSLIGKHAPVKKSMDNTVIGAFMTGIRSQIPSYINALLDSNQFAIEINKNLGATINQITTGVFKKMKFLFPSNEEQSKIGRFFAQLDDSISLHQRELDALKETKKAFLQKMFI
jgi:type I restriction enzyme, S subunit